MRKHAAVHRAAASLRVGAHHRHVMPASRVSPLHTLLCVGVDVGVRACLEVVCTSATARLHLVILCNHESYSVSGSRPMIFACKACSVYVCLVYHLKREHHELVAVAWTWLGVFGGWSCCGKLRQLHLLIGLWHCTGAAIIAIMCCFNTRTTRLRNR